MYQLFKITFLIFISLVFGTLLIASQEQANEYWSQGEQAVQKGELIEAAKKFSEAAKSELESSNPRREFIANAYHQVGYYCHQAGDFENAVTYYQMALEINQQLKGREELIAIESNNMGIILNSWLKYDLSIQYLSIARPLFNKLEYVVNVAIVDNYLGLNHAALGKYKDAVENYQSAILINKQLKNVEQLTLNYNNLADVLRIQGQYDQSFAYYKKAISLLKDIEGAEYLNNVIFNNIGMVHYAKGDYQKALESHLKALRIGQKLGMSEPELAIDLNNIARTYLALGGYRKAMDFFKLALKGFKTGDQKGNIATCLGNIGEVYRLIDQYQSAISYFDQAVSILNELGLKRLVAINFNNIGNVYNSWGRFKKAILYYEKAVELNRNMGLKDLEAVGLMNIGTVYLEWGHYEKAVSYIEQSRDLNLELGNRGQLTTTYSNLGLVYTHQKKYQKAIEVYQKAIELSESSGQLDQASTQYNNMGHVLSELGHIEQAKVLFEKAMIIDKKLNRQGSYATTLNNLGNILVNQGQFEEGVEYFKKSLSINRNINRQPELARDFHNIGVAHYFDNKLKNSIPNLIESIEIKESLRNTATGAVRREYLESQITTYQYLISAYINEQDVEKAFHISELSRSKLLAENLSIEKQDIRIPNLKDIQSALPEDTLVIMYANSSEEFPNLVQIAISNNGSVGKEISKHKILSALEGKFKKQINDFSLSQRGIKLTKKRKKGSSKDRAKNQAYELSQVINYYRNLISNPGVNPTRGIKLLKKKASNHLNNEVAEISHSLYELLIQPVFSDLKNKKKIIIVSDGILAFLPFETLLDASGRYLIEKFDVKYVQSLTILDLIKKRNYSRNRKQLLAFGGATYEKIKNGIEKIQSENQLKYINKKLGSSVLSKAGFRDEYSALNIIGWTPLPGTLDEVQKIQGVYPGSEIIIGDKVTERKLKKLSEANQLKQYKILHFATHGVAVPSVPRLSALVLSQFQSPENIEDGYVRVSEISRLKINADLVNLSACETGLGKIYNGEGVVGLTQSFLIAGANALTVSLWSVADTSTAEFMISLYQLSKQKNAPFDLTMANVKRKFIEGEFGNEFSAPYFWAPFVYYGK